jgi:predicted MPP superfamily phosphohydrolase
MMLNVADKFNIVRWFFVAVSLIYVFKVVYNRIRNKGIPLLLKLTSLPVIFGMGSFIDMYWIEPNLISTERIIIRDPELARVLAGLKVVQISDIHIGDKIGYRERELIEKVNDLKPDLLFITGDFFSAEKGQDASMQFVAIKKVIISLKASVGIYGVIGNYDTFLTGHPERLQEMKSAGIDILVNESREILLPNNQVLWIAGIDHSWDPQTNLSTSAKLARSLENIPTGSPVILLNHYPDIFGRAFESGINLVLAGHTHGGQIGIPFLIHLSNSANKSPFMRGLFDTGKTKMYVNRGIGTTNIPVRYMCSPEITLLDFKA